MDAWGPMFPNQKVDYNYGLLLIDSASRWPVAFPLKNLTAKAVCNCLMQLFMQTGLDSSVTIASDNGSNFNAALTQALMKCMGCSPRYNNPWHPSLQGMWKGQLVL
jgi:Integrase core domain